jgi:hypothetical protein
MSKQLTSIEELDALPLHSYIREWDGFHNAKTQEGWLLIVAGASEPRPSSQIELPATLLYLKEG